MMSHYGNKNIMIQPIVFVEECGKEAVTTSSGKAVQYLNDEKQVKVIPISRLK